jgi:membrane-associated protease RseP (regulator of RpoE activity)
MLNFDMVGRLKNQTLYVGGQGTAKDLDAILAAAETPVHLTVKSIGRGGLGPSDHMSFAQKHIPVLFLFSGIHSDYHRPTDTSDKINYVGIDQVVAFAANIVDGLTRMPQEPYLVAADRDSFNLFGVAGTFGGPPRRVRLGVIPDYGSVDSRKGALISGTSPGTPAEAAGLRGGDTIVQFGNQPILNLMDLTQALDEAHPGDKVMLKIVRDGQTLSIDVTLAERKD